MIFGQAISRILYSAKGGTIAIYLVPRLPAGSSEPLFIHCSAVIRRFYADYDADFTPIDLRVISVFSASWRIRVISAVHCEAMSLFLLRAGFTIRGCHQPEMIVAFCLETKRHQPTFHVSSLLRSDPPILRGL